MVETSIINPETIDEEKINKYQVEGENIASQFINIPTQYDTIIENLATKGWIGNTNSNFVTSSEKYKSNIETMKAQLEDFFREFNESTTNAINQFKK